MKKHALYAWGPEHNQAFDNIKKEIVQAPILRYCDLKKKTVLQTDASIKGHGTCLLQDRHPVYFEGKSLHNAECGYVAIELKGLAVAWVMEKFHHFLYAWHFTLETDQKPLETILAKSLTEARPQLQWFSIPFHASKSKILREDTMKKVRIMKTKEQVQEQYPELFKGIGWFPGEPYHIHTNPSITPKQTPCRPIPVHLKQTFQQEIEKMLTTRVIKPSLKQLHG